MTRRRRQLKWIAHDGARKTCFRKRRLGLMKKMDELTTLCGIPGMCVIYGPDEEPSPFHPLKPPEPPMAWPSREAATQLMERFLSMPAVERSKKMTNQQGYLREVIVKAEAQRRRDLKKVQDLELALLMDEVRYGKGLDGLDTEQFKSLAWLIQVRIREIRRRMELLGCTQPLEAHDDPLHGMNQTQIATGTMDHPICIDEDHGSSTLLDGSGDSTVVTELAPNEYDGMDVELHLGTARK